MDNDRNKIRKEIQKIMEKEHGRSFLESEVEEVDNFLRIIAEITVQNVLTEHQWKNQLSQHPKGFQLDGKGRSCPICRCVIGKGQGWYDKNGLKCATCQRALEKRIIPVSLMKKRESYYTETELNISFNLTRTVLNFWIKEQIIITRVIPALDKGTHIRLFLLKDNKGFLPPKRLLKGGMHVEEEDGKKEYVFGPWYYYCDPLKKLAKYGITNYMVWKTPDKNDLGDAKTL